MYYNTVCNENLRLLYIYIEYRVSVTSACVVV